MPAQILLQRAAGVSGLVKIFQQVGMFRHRPDILPVVFHGETHHFEDSPELLLVIRIVRSRVLLFAVKDGLQRQ